MHVLIAWSTSVDESIRGWIVALSLFFGGLWAVWNYRVATQKSRAEWLSRLFDMFYRDAANKRTRIMVDGTFSTGLQPVLERVLIDSNAALSDEEQDQLADLDVLLNHLEFILHLEQQGQLGKDNRTAMFGYWYGVLERPEYAALRLYVHRFGYEALSASTRQRVAAFPPGGRVAFYGTLRNATGKLRELGVADKLSLVGSCQIAGQTLDLGDFPGLVPRPGIVEGDLFEIRDLTVFDVLDEYEEFQRSNPAGSLFQRRYVRLVSPECDAWVYYFNDSRVGSGDVHAN